MYLCLPLTWLKCEGFCAGFHRAGLTPGFQDSVANLCTEYRVQSKFRTSCPRGSGYKFTRGSNTISILGGVSTHGLWNFGGVPYLAGLCMIGCMRVYALWIFLPIWSGIDC